MCGCVCDGPCVVVFICLCLTRVAILCVRPRFACERVAARWYTWLCMVVNCYLKSRIVVCGLARPLVWQLFAVPMWLLLVAFLCG